MDPLIIKYSNNLRYSLNIDNNNGEKFNNIRYMESLFEGINKMFKYKLNYFDGTSHSVSEKDTCNSIVQKYHISELDLQNSNPLLKSRYEISNTLNGITNLNLIDCNANLRNLTSLYIPIFTFKSISGNDVYISKGSSYNNNKHIHFWINNDGHLQWRLTCRTIYGEYHSPFELFGQPEIDLDIIYDILTECNRKEDGSGKRKSVKKSKRKSKRKSVKKSRRNNRKKSFRKSQKRKSKRKSQRKY